MTVLKLTQTDGSEVEISLIGGEIHIATLEDDNSYSVISQSFDLEEFNKIVEFVNNNKNAAS